MKQARFFLFVLALVMISGLCHFSFSQSEPVMFFCERYDNTYGEVGISDRFTTGYLTVMVKSDDALGLTDCSIQFDKLNTRTNSFEYYKKFNFVVRSSMKYVYFSKNENADMKFDTPGIYRVFLLDSGDNTVASSLIEIIR